jgi:hypothetical protein
MGRGEGNSEDGLPLSPPQILVGDWVCFKEGQYADAIAEVLRVDEGYLSLSVIIHGRLATTVRWVEDCWEKTLPPENVPVSWNRSSASPSNGLPQTYPWSSRSTPTHPALVDFDPEVFFRGEMYIKGDATFLATALALATSIIEEGSWEGWEEWVSEEHRPFVSLDPEAKAAADLLAACSNYNDHGFIHNYYDQTPREYTGHNICVMDLELHTDTDDAEKGLEALLEIFEARGYGIKLSLYDESAAEDQDFEYVNEAWKAAPIDWN